MRINKNKLLKIDYYLCLLKITIIEQHRNEDRSQINDKKFNSSILNNP